MTRDKLVRTAILVAGPRVPPAEGAASAPKTAEAPEAVAMCSGVRPVASRFSSV